MVQKDYFGREKKLLNFVGVSMKGNESLGYKIYSTVLIYGLSLSYPFISMGDLFNNEFNVVADVLMFISGASLTIVCILIIQWNRRRIGVVLDRFEQPPFIPNSHRDKEEEEEIINKFLALNRMQGIAFYIAIAITVFGGFTLTLFTRLRSDDYHDWKLSFGRLTVLNITYSPNFEITWLYQNFIIGYYGCAISAILLLFSGVLSLTTVQFQMLQNYLKSIVFHSYKEMLMDASVDNSCVLDSIALKKDTFDTSLIPWKYLNVCLKRAVLFHLDIMRIVKDVEEIFSPILLSVHFATLPMLCFGIYRASVTPPNDYETISMVFIPIFAVLFLPFLTCYWGEEVAYESSKLVAAVYESNFVGTDVRFQKALEIIMSNCQNVSRIKAVKTFEMSMVTFVWILRASYSSFMLLRRISGESSKL